MKCWHVGSLYISPTFSSYCCHCPFYMLFANCHQNVVLSYILIFENVPLVFPTWKRNSGCLYVLYPSSTSLWNHFRSKLLCTYVHTSNDVRPYTLRTYVHTPFERTCIHPWTYVQRKKHLRKRDICPEIVIFQACENRIFPHGGILGWFYRVFRGF